MNKLFTDINSVFIDTGVFIDLLKIDNNNLDRLVSDRINQTKLFFTSLSEASTKITFQTSAINIAELFNVGNDNPSSMSALLEITNQNDLEVFAFDVFAASYHNTNFAKFAGNKAIDEIKKQVSYISGNGLANIKDRIRKDMLIIALPKMYGSDLVLTNDSGFKKLCDILNMSCHLFDGDISKYLTSQSGTKIYGLR